MFRHGPYWFFFSSVNEEFEPIHVHVESGGAYAKLWLERVAFVDSRGFSAKQMNELRKPIVSHQQKCVEAWDEFFSRKA